MDPDRLRRRAPSAIVALRGLVVALGAVYAVSLLLEERLRVVPAQLARVPA